MRLVTAVLTFLLLATCLSACKTAPFAGPHRPGTINHFVLFKLQNPADADELIRDCNDLAKQVPGVVSSYAGKPLDTGRPTVDRDYDVAFYAGFGRVEDYTAYTQHPAHLATVSKWKPRWQWIRVHDVKAEP